MLCYDCFSWQSPSSKLFGFSPLRWFGNMNYSYYLFHGLAIKFSITLFSKTFFATQADDLISFVVLELGGYFLTLIPVFLLFISIEKPFSLAKNT